MSVTRRYRTIATPIHTIVSVLVRMAVLSFILWESIPGNPIAHRSSSPTGCCIALSFESKVKPWLIPCDRHKPFAPHNSTHNTTSFSSYDVDVPRHCRIGTLGTAKISKQWKVYKQILNLTSSVRNIHHQTCRGIITHHFHRHYYTEYFLWSTIYATIILHYASKHSDWVSSFSSSSDSTR